MSPVSTEGVVFTLSLGHSGMILGTAHCRLGGSSVLVTLSVQEAALLWMDTERPGPPKAPQEDCGIHCGYCFPLPRVIDGGPGLYICSCGISLYLSLCSPSLPALFFLAILDPHLTMLGDCSWHSAS